MKKAIWITAYYKDYVGKNWQDAYFQLLAWKNTWGIPYNMDINSTSKHEAYLSMIIPEHYEEQVLEMISDLGYRNIREEVGTVGFVPVEYDENVDWWIVEENF